jgi:NAD(P)-dependent dehydrogenase (short-subunit alcohol dehydrogenase family)
MPIAVVTGANRGLGLATSKALAAKGFKVYMCMRNLEHAQEYTEEIKSLGGEVEVIRVDVTKTGQMRGLASVIHDRKEKIDVIVNNAGVFLEPFNDQEASSVLKTDPVIVLKTIEVNTMGPLRIVQALEDTLSEGARIINISSGMGALTDMSGNWPGYRMSKTALNALTRILSTELKDKKISVNSVCPGWVRTDMGGENATRSLEEGITTTVWLATMENPPTGGFYRDCEAIDW